MRVGLMHQGSIMLLDRPAEIKRSLSGVMIEIWTGQAREASGIARATGGVKSVSIYGDKLHVALEDRKRAGAVRENLEQAGIPVEGEREVLPSLEDVFIAMVEKR
jgi:ABC-2 type transport system ATP-binding protein